MMPPGRLRRSAGSASCQDTLQPQVDSVRARTPFGGFDYATIDPEVMPSVPPEVVDAVYRKARREISGEHKYRRIEEKGLKMIRFIAGYDEPPKGRRLLEAWNITEWVKKNPKWSYDEGKPGESSRFWKHYPSARQALAYTKRSEIGDG
jgi:hypothetical protein